MATVYSAGAVHQSVGFWLDDSEPAGGHSQEPTSGDPIRNEESPDIETIDPAILNDHKPSGNEQISANGVCKFLFCQSI